MKRLAVYLTVAAFTFTVGIFVGGTSRDNLPTTVKNDCSENSFTVEDDAEVPARLIMVEALCEETTWKVEINLENIGSKTIGAYEIENFESYEYKKNVEFSLKAGINLEPNESKRVISFGGGFPSGTSYGKPTGRIQSNMFRIKHLEFADGTHWTNLKSRKD